MQNKNNVNFGDMITGGIIGFVIGSTIYVILKSFIDKTDIIATLAFIAGCVAAFIALKQLYQNAKKNEGDREWNTKYLAYTQLNEYVKYLEEKRTLLDELTIEHQLIKVDDKFISFSDRRGSRIPLTYEEIHNYVCKQDDNGNKIVHTQLNGKDIYSMTKEGAEVIRAIISIINTYELISSGVSEGMIQKELILKMIKTAIISNFEFFKEYIEHRRTHHESITFATEWEKLYLELKEGN